MYTFRTNSISVRNTLGSELRSSLRIKHKQERGSGQGNS